MALLRPTLQVMHNIASGDRSQLTLDKEKIELQTKSLILDSPQIGGVVGIGQLAGIQRVSKAMKGQEKLRVTLLP